MTVSSSAAVHALDLAAPRREVAHQVSHVLVGRGDLDVHDRLEQRRLRGRHRLLVGERARELERELGGVDVVVLAVVEDHAEVDHRESGEEALLADLLDALLDGRDEVARDRAP
jgi:hypothetical protein